jgi:glycosyltransferase involved in cell wall biosynthesis
MLSILIPTYNYNVVPLVLELHKQCLECEIDFEILCQDDGSKQFQVENQKINSLENCHFEVLETNIGRSAIRNLLAKKAKFENLLFLDADTIPVYSNFINKYTESINLEYQVVLGGLRYENNKPDDKFTFRLKYGKKREEKKHSERNINPYQFVFSGNILIKKKKFLATNYAGNNSFYGMDVFFAYQLFIKKIEILHIENPIYHLGLESNIVFFEKSLKAVESRKQFLIDCDQIEKLSPLIKSYKKIKKYKLLPIVRLIFKLTKPILKNLILNKNPNLHYFDLYRLGYLCSLK